MQVYKIRTRYIWSNIRSYVSVSTKPVKFETKTITVPSISKKHKIPYDITYIDTTKDDRLPTPEMPTVLLLHGTPGSYEDFRFQIPMFQNKGIRVLCPNFPNYNFVHETKRQYRHSPQDRTDFVKSLLLELNITKIDMLVSHSSALYPSLLLSRINSEPKIFSTALLNPATHIISRVVKPISRSRTMVYLGERKFTYDLIKKYALGFFQSISPVKIKDIDHTLYALTTILTAGFENVQNSLLSLRQEKHPLLLVYSLNDKLFEYKMYQNMEKFFVPEYETLQNVTWEYNENEELLKQGSRKDWVKIVKLAGGTHYSMWKHHELINNLLIEQLDSVSKVKYS